jgi:oxidase EvaA
MKLKLSTDSKESNFLRSTLTPTNELQPFAELRRWFDSAASALVRVERIPFSKLKKWRFDPISGDLAHDSGKFFRVEGLGVEMNFGPVSAWQQPIINQPEIGILGIVTRKFGGVPHFLMQNKVEPGNVNLFQLSPTVQATKSNYTQVHAGRLPPYLGYFLDAGKHEVLYDQLQSEQGGRFLKKRNRNILIEVAEELPLEEGFRWFTLRELKTLLQEDNLVNINSRTVISCIPLVDASMKSAAAALSSTGQISLDGHTLTPFGGELLASMLADDKRSVLSGDKLISWITTMKSTYDLRTYYIPLKELTDWERTENEIRHKSGKHFSVIAIDVETGLREVSRWTQPLVKDEEHGLIGFLCKNFDGVLHFLVSAKVEPGNFDMLELGPTVSCAQFERRAAAGTLPPFAEQMLRAPAERIRHTSLQSDEGGRFYHFQNRYLVVELGADERLELPQNFAWMTLGQIMGFMRYNNYFNIEARGLLACLKLD